jgi:universal protein Kae1
LRNIYIFFALQLLPPQIFSIFFLLTFGKYYLPRKTICTEMICLGIEGTAHTVGIGIVKDNRILANVSKVYVPKDGIHPREAANHHAKNILPVLKEALSKANINIKDLELIAFSQGPGLGPCLRTVATAARALSLSLKIPVIGVNHCIAHLEIGRSLTKCKDPVLLYVSGGNTQVISFSNSRYRVFGETLDIGIGNMLDKFGRALGLPFPSGPEIERLAKKGAKLLDLPYSVKGMDVAFSGILTAALHLIDIEKLEDICYSLQEITFAMLTEVTERAMAHLDKNEILLGGGVACNKRLQKMLNDMCEARNAKLFIPEPQFCLDNGAMIALTGLLMHRSGLRMKLDQTEIKQRFRTDDVDVKWRR